MAHMNLPGLTQAETLQYMEIEKRIDSAKANFMDHAHKARLQGKIALAQGGASNLKPPQPITPEQAAAKLQRMGPSWRVGGDVEKLLGPTHSGTAQPPTQPTTQPPTQPPPLTPGGMPRPPGGTPPGSNPPPGSGTPPPGGFPFSYGLRDPSYVPGGGRRPQGPLIAHMGPAPYQMQPKATPIPVSPLPDSVREAHAKYMQIPEVERPSIQDLLKHKAGQLVKGKDILGKGGLAESLAGAGQEGLGKTGQTVGMVGKAMAGDPMAMIGLAKQQIDDIKKSISGMAAGAGRALKGETVGEVGGGIGGGISSAGKLVTKTGLPIVGKGMEYGGKLLTMMAESVDKLRDFNESLHNSNMKFAEYSGTMARVSAEQEVRDIQLSRERGDRRAASAGYLAEQKTRLQQQITPWEDAWANIKNQLFGFISEKFADVVAPLTAIARRFGFLSPEGTGLTGGIGELMAQNADIDWTSTYGRPIHMGPLLPGARDPLRRP